MSDGERTQARKGAHEQARKSARKQAGFALVLVLVFLAPLTLIAATMTTGGRASTRAAIALREAAQAEALADAGVYATAADLLTASSDRARDNSETVREVVLPFDLPGARVMVSVTDLSALIDVNLASEVLLRCAFQQAGFSESGAESLVVALRGEKGEEEEKRKPPKLLSVDDLRKAPGMTAERFRALEGSLTVFGGPIPSTRDARPLVKAALQCEREAQGRRRPLPREEARPSRVVRIQSLATFRDARFTRDATVDLSQGSVRVRAWRRQPPAVSS